MEQKRPTRQEALELLHEYNKSDSLRKHAYAVEGVMRYIARRRGEDEEKWGTVGLIHDLDYEKYPDPASGGHPFEGAKILHEKGYPEDIIQAILGHAIYSGVPRESRMAKCLFAVDELCGFIMAVAYMRPDHLNGMEVKSVEKRLKTKNCVSIFAVKTPDSIQSQVFTNSNP